MSKVFRPYEPEQMLPMPVCLREWLPPDHLAYFISDVVDQMDLSTIMRRYEAEERGYPPYHPRMMGRCALCLLHWGALLPENRKEAQGGHRFQGAFGQQHPGLQDHRRFQEGPPTGPGWAVPSGREGDGPGHWDASRCPGQPQCPRQPPMSYPRQAYSHRPLES